MQRAKFMKHDRDSGTLNRHSLICSQCGHRPPAVEVTLVRTKIDARSYLGEIERELRRLSWD
jgi:hypothetical protein